MIPASLAAVTMDEVAPAAEDGQVHTRLAAVQTTFAASVCIVDKQATGRGNVLNFSDYATAAQEEAVV